MSKVEKSNPIRVQYIRERSDFESAIQVLAHKKTLFVDLELDNMHHYHTQMSLIQILSGQTCYVIDLMADLPIQQLLDKVQDSLFVMHGSDFDLRMMLQFYSFTPKFLYDTLIAAKMLGHEAFGLASLVKHYFGVDLEKKYQKADWSQRPLRSEMIEYAAMDTFYLPEMKDAMDVQLREKKRTKWHEESCRRQLRAAQIQKPREEDSLWRIKGSARLSPRQLAILKDMAIWRDEVGRERNRPLYKILTNDSMLTFCTSVPADRENKFQFKQKDLKCSQSLQPALYETIKKALARPSNQWPKVKKPERNRYSTQPNSVLIDKLKQARDEIAAKLKLSPFLLASNDLVYSFARGLVPKSEDSEKTAMNWQEELLFPAWKALIGDYKPKIQE